MDAKFVEKHCISTLKQIRNDLGMPELTWQDIADNVDVYLGSEDCRLFQILDTETQEALTDWYNSTDLRFEEAIKLHQLWVQDAFEYWTCNCGVECQHGEPEDAGLDWGDFQAISNQDYATYPGDSETYTEEAIKRQCDTCRSKALGIPIVHSFN